MRVERDVGAQRDWGRDGDGLEEKPLGELMRELVSEGQTLLREEVRLAKAELRNEAKKAGKAGAMMGAGGAVLYVALMCLAATLVLIGATFMPAWLSALIVTALLGVAGFVALRSGQAELKKTDPSRPVKNLKEDGRWAKETMQSIKSSRPAHG
jgi:uncharacterized membrane protein YqjE